MNTEAWVRAARNLRSALQSFFFMASCPLGLGWYDIHYRGEYLGTFREREVFDLLKKNQALLVDEFDRVVGIDPCWQYKFCGPRNGRCP